MFFSDPTRVKTDWPALYAQISKHIQSGQKNALTQSMYDLLLERIAAERVAYRDDLVRECDERLAHLSAHYDAEPKWALIRADHTNQYRAEIRSKMRWLDVWEEALENAFMATFA